jgi:N-methylhydantoinase B
MTKKTKFVNARRLRMPLPMARPTTKPDAILTAIIRNGVSAVTNEMKTNLMRTAYNMIIYEALDFTVGLFTPDGDTISIGLGLPMFIRGMAETVKAKLKRFGKEGLAEGDILVTNDAYLTGSHLNHVTFTMPIFHERVLSGFSCCMAHWTDVGGTLDGITTDIYSEGLQIPIMKYQKGGIVNEDLIELIRMNVRIPQRAMGDLRAQITAVKTGERRFLELLRRYGRDKVLIAVCNIMDQSEAIARAHTRSIPDGTYVAESYMDDDGVDIGRRVPIRVKVVVDGDSMTIDLSDVSPQVRGFFNSGATTGIACAQVAYKCLTSPSDYPINEGSFRSLNVVLGARTIVSAVKPAAMRWWMSFPMTIVDTIFKALEPGIPGRIIAGHHADLVVPLIHGISDGYFYIGAAAGGIGGGWGAKQSEDGASATICMNDGDTHNSPIEQAEAKYPILVEHYRLRQDSGGAGTNRGGLGTEQCIQACALMTVNLQIDRVHCAPWGLQGGHAGMGNRVDLRIDGRQISDLPNGKVLTQRLKPGDAFTVLSGGGGGFGPPRQRKRRRVLHDLEQEYISKKTAREIYGVDIDNAALGDENRARSEAIEIKNSRP